METIWRSVEIDNFYRDFVMKLVCRLSGAFIEF